MGVRSKLNKTPSSAWLLGLTSLSVLFLVLMNLFATRPIGMGDFMLTNAGVLLIAPVLVIQNIITDVWGKRTAFGITIFAVVCQVAVVLLIHLVILLPTNNAYAATSWADAFGSSWRIVAASVVAFVVGSILNILVFDKINVRAKDTGGRLRRVFVAAAIVSTVVAQFVDSSIFMILAFAPVGLPTFELSWTNIWTSIVVGTSVQLIIEAILIVSIAAHLSRWLKDKLGIENRTAQESKT